MFFYFLYQGKDERDKRKDNMRFYKCMKSSQLYYAHSLIYLFCKDPFTNASPKLLFDTSLFVITLLNGTMCKNDRNGILLSFVLYTLAKNAQIIGVYNVAKFAYRRLSTLYVRFEWRDKLALEVLLIQVSILVN
jgi:hypothetical protein